MIQICQIWVVLSRFRLGVFRARIRPRSRVVQPLHARHDRTVAAVGQCHGRIRDADVVNSEWGTITDPRLVWPILSDEEWMKAELAAVAETLSPAIYRMSESESLLKSFQQVPTQCRSGCHSSKISPYVLPL
jgi:CHAD domain-containing protein